MKKIPIGTEDFKEIITGNGYYVDKTKAIELIEEYGNNRKVILFTRPRRFGKTLFLSMLDYFYNIENKDNTKLFDNLYISKTKYIKKQGQYPIINCTLKDIGSKTFSGMLKLLKIKFNPIIRRIRNFKNISKDILDSLDQIDKEDIDVMSVALKIFTEAYKINYNKKVIILIDEYEAPLIEAYNNGYIDEALRFFSILYSSVLKTNSDNLEKAVISGITKLSHNNIFSGLNNMVSNTFNDVDFADTFGFTQEEVDQLFNYFNIKEYRTQVKEYYDGYTFGDKEIYNPWSIVNFSFYKELKPYWAYTSSVEIIRNLLQKGSNDLKANFFKLLNGEIINISDTNINNLVISDLDVPSKLFAFMVNTGYLTFIKGKGVKFVNKEMMYSIASICSGGIYKEDSINNLVDGFNHCNIEKISANISEIYNILSYYDINKSTSENAYHISLALLLKSLGIGEVYSNLEAGKGRLDIALVNIKNEYYSYVIEVKVANNKNDIKKQISKGFEQIKEKSYLDFLKNIEKKAMLVVCFYKKEVYVDCEIINNGGL